VQSKSESNEIELLKLRGEVAVLRNAASDPTEIEAKAWTAKVSKLKQRLEEMPDAKIPELQFLNDQDWLTAASKKLDTDADYRRALATLRSMAENKFGKMYQHALQSYLDSNNNQYPTDVSQLESYFNPPIDEAVLQRWKLIPANNANGSEGLGGNLVLTEKVPVDELFDSRNTIGLHSSGTGGFFFFDNGIVLAPLYKAFATANPRINPGLAPSASQLLPYATTQEQQAIIGQLLLRESAGE
jgi:hypothetical protein